MNDVLIHHGVKGQKWGIRRYQNADGSYKSGAEGRYDGDGTSSKVKRSSGSKQQSSSESTKKSGLTDQQKKNLKTAAIVGASVAATALAAYGTYKAAQFIQEKRNDRAMVKATEYLNDNFYEKVYDFKDVFGNTVSVYDTRNGNGVHDARAKNETWVRYNNEAALRNSDAIYRENTDTKLDRAVNKVVKTGNKVGDKVSKTKKEVKRNMDVARYGTAAVVEEGLANVLGKTADKIDKFAEWSRNYKYK